jgi:hypothetical protein
MNANLDLVTRLVKIADALTQSSTVQISDQNLRQLRDEVQKARMQIAESDFQVDYQSTCLIECISALAYARTDKDQSAEQRALKYVDLLRQFLRIDRDLAERKLAS